jgi:hypothetical protein
MELKKQMYHLPVGYDANRKQKLAEVLSLSEFVIPESRFNCFE